jgi:hypothetical protein
VRRPRSFKNCRATEEEEEEEGKRIVRGRVMNGSKNLVQRFTS